MNILCANSAPWANPPGSTTYGASSGEFRRLIAEDGLRGITSNSAILENSITGGHDYDEDMALQGKSVSRTTAYQWETYYFCSPGCLAKFEKAPGRYADQQPLNPGK